MHVIIQVGYRPAIVMQNYQLQVALGLVVPSFPFASIATGYPDLDFGHLGPLTQGSLIYIMAKGCYSPLPSRCR